MESLEYVSKCLGISKQMAAQAQKKGLQKV
jgi:hypothetical protein